MAISRIPGYALLSDLDRQGTDLSFTTNSIPLVYMDFATYTVGINETNPAAFGQSLTVGGNILLHAGHLLSSGNVQYDLGNVNHQWRSVYAANIIAGTFTTNSLSITGNTSSNVIYASAIYDSNYRVLTSNSNVIVNGDVSGSGNAANIYVTLINSGATAGMYGAGDAFYSDQIPQITVNSKGIITNISNVSLSKIGNVSFANGTVSTVANLTLSPGSGYYINANSSIIANVANPVSSQDVVTLNYLNATRSNPANISANNSSVSVIDNNVTAGVIQTMVDGLIVGNVSTAYTTIYNTANIGNLSITNNTVTSTGNLILTAQGTGAVQISGSLALGLPVGDDLARPSNPSKGYTRFNTVSSTIEVYTGTEWIIPGQSSIVSDVINPDGTSNVYTLSSNTTTSGVIVSINGTMQQPTTAYTVSNNSIAFTEIPLTTDTIEVRHIVSGTTTVSPTIIKSGTTQVSADSANVNITGNVLPSANITYDVGSPTLSWRTGYFANVIARHIPRIGSITSASSVTPNSDIVDQVNVTALAAGLSILAPTGTPVDGQTLNIRLKDNGTARALTWTTTSGGYRIIGTTLPTTTVISKTVYIRCIYNAADGFWDVLQVSQQV